MPFNFSFPFFHHHLSPIILKRKLLKRPFQIEVSSWITNSLRPLQDKTTYLEYCQNQPYFVLDTKTIQNLFRHLHPYTTLGKPGHDLGHLYRDYLSGSVLSGTDPYAAKAYQNDLTAAFLGSAYHDIGNSIGYRFQDYLWECGHAEIGAWLFYHLTEKHLPEHIRRLTAYAIAAHTHQLKPVETKIGFSRLPWSDDLFENEGHPVRVSVWITRFADRLDTNGVNLLCRHIIASVEGAKQEGRNFSGDDWYEINRESLSLLLKPDTILVGTTPSALKHVENFANSAKTHTPYSQHDDLFPVMRELMDYKIKQAEKLIEIVRTQSGTPDFPKFKSFVAKLSGSPVITSTLNNVETLWNELTEGEQSHWGPAFSFIEQSYSDWLRLIQTKINNGDSGIIRAVKPLTAQIISKIS